MNTTIQVGVWGLNPGKTKNALDILFSRGERKSINIYGRFKVTS